MSGPYDYPMSVPPLEHFDPSYSVYDSGQYGGFHRISGPPTPHEGFGFWFRPNPQETIYHHDATLFENAMPMQAVAMEAPGAIKHRRTRSGCFTCRSRRVKCDETRPRCDRCRKGNRECEFPQSTSFAKTSKKHSDSKSVASETSPDRMDIKLDTIESEDEDDEEDYEEDDEPMPPPTKPKPQRSNPSRIRTSSKSDHPPGPYRRSSQTNIQTTTTPSTEVSGSATPVSATTSRETPPSPAQRWKKIRPGLNQEMQEYLQYQHDHMTHYHYLFKLDPQDFVHGEFIDLALRFEPLLYAVIAFAAYHYTVRLPDSQSNFDNFWKYYCKSIVKLRKHLESSNDRNDLVLLTVLQLATFEEYMGDWTNLATHHRAAYGILVARYTPQSIMSSDRGRKILDWFVRLDVIVGLMAVQDNTLDRSWLSYAHEWYNQCAASNEVDKIDNLLENFTKSVELVGYDIAHTFAKINETQALVEKGHRIEFTPEDLLQEVQVLNDRLDNLRRKIQELHYPALQSVDENLQKADDDVFVSKVPLFRGVLWPLNLVWISWYGINMVLKKQTMLAMQKAQRLQMATATSPSSLPDETSEDKLPPIPQELTEYAKIQCHIYNAIASSPTSPPGAILVCYANLGLSTVFLPRAPPQSNAKYTLWARRQLAEIERHGYVWPPQFRKEMAQLWAIPELEQWWLPNNEGKKRILGEIRAVVEDRLSAATGNDGRADLREIKGLFEKMDFGRRSSDASLPRLDPTYVNSTQGMMNAASMVSSPEEGSAGSASGSVKGFSPRTSSTDLEMGRMSRSRKLSLADSPRTTNKNMNRTSGMWEERR